MYSYALNNPVRYNDPSGKAAETAWDVLNVSYDAGRASKNIFESAYEGWGLMWNLYVTGDVEAAAKYADSYEKDLSELAESGVDLGADAAATVIPFVPAGITKVARKIDKAAEIAKDAGKITNNVGKQIKSLEEGITSLGKNIAEHKDKILNPDKYIDISKAKGDLSKWKEGLIKKWEKEIKTFNTAIQKNSDKINELKKTP